MAEVTKGVTNPSISTPWPAKENLLTGLLTGENIAQGDACYINAAGAVMRASGADWRTQHPRVAQPGLLSSSIPMGAFLPSVITPKGGLTHG
jgi:hypothetical protein